MDQLEFVRLFRNRTKQLAIDIIKFYKGLPKTDENIIVGKQLIRSASSVGANYGALCRSRSDAELYAKMCIVVEEADETLFWLEVLEQIGIPNLEMLDKIKTEATEILSVMAKSRSTLKRRLNSSSTTKSKDAQ